MRFEWDEAKRLSNIQKHGIDFADLLPLFEGDTFTIEDARFNYDETRYITLGLLKLRVILVAHTERKDVVRIISQERRRQMKKNNTLTMSGSDWKRVDAMADGDIDLTDIPEITPEQFAKAIVRRGLKPIKKRQLTLRLDSDVVEWFKLQGRGYQTQMNALLRAYMEEQKTASRRTKTTAKRI